MASKTQLGLEALVERTGSQRLGVCEEVMQASLDHPGGRDPGKSSDEFLSRAGSQTQVALETRWDPQSALSRSGSAYCWLSW